MCSDSRIHTLQYKSSYYTSSMVHILEWLLLVGLLSGTSCQETATNSWCQPFVYNDFKSGKLIHWFQERGLVSTVCACTLLVCKAHMKIVYEYVKWQPISCGYAEVKNTCRHRSNYVCFITMTNHKYKWSVCMTDHSLSHKTHPTGVTRWTVPRNYTSNTIQLQVTARARSCAQCVFHASFSWTLLSVACNVE